MDTGRNPSTGIKQSPISIIPDSFHHADLLCGGDSFVPAAGSRFQRSTINAYGFIQSLEPLHLLAAISDSADQVSDLFQVRPFATQTDSTSTSNSREPGIPNKAVLPTAFRAGCLKVAAWLGAQSRWQLTQPSRLRCLGLISPAVYGRLWQT